MVKRGGTHGGYLEVGDDGWTGGSVRLFFFFVVGGMVERDSERGKK